MIDLSQAWAADSSRLNADDFLAGPRTMTVAGVEFPEGDKPRVHMVESPGRPLLPAKGVGRVMRAVWGDDGEKWAGRKVTLYNDPDVMFGKDKTGGIRVSHMSHMDKPRTFKIMASQRKRETVTIQPLSDDAPTTEPHPDWHALIEQAEGDVDTLRNIYQHAAELGASEGVLNAIKTAATKEN